MNYEKIKKLDLESLKKLTDGKGPADECLCTILAPPDEQKGRFGGVGASLKRVFTSMTKTGRAHAHHTPRMQGTQGTRSVTLPVTFSKGTRGVHATREVVKRKNSCGKCGCDKNDVVLKHADATLTIITPDISTICPCSQNCLPEKAKLANNIKVTVERVELPTASPFDRDPDNDDSEFSEEEKLDFPHRQILSEPVLERQSISQLIDAQYDGDGVFSKFSSDDY